MRNHGFRSHKNVLAAALQPPADRGLVMLATFMEVLDTSVANVSLPHIAGSLAASNDEAIWVLTSYLVANAVVLPMTGWLGDSFGRKRFLTICIAFSRSHPPCAEPLTPCLR